MVLSHVEVKLAITGVDDDVLPTQGIEALPEQGF